MGKKFASFILKNRVVITLFVVIVTALMGYMGKNIGLRYQIPRLLPSDHPDWVSYIDFKENFGSDGLQVLIGVKDEEFYTPDKYNNWRELGEELKNMRGVDSVFSEASLYVLKKDDSLKRFKLEVVHNKKVNTQAEVDSIEKKVKSYPFYKGAIYNEQTNFHVMLVSVNQKFFNSKERGTFIKELVKKTKKYESVYESEFYFSGLPFIRASNMNNIRDELQVFLILSLIATILVLFLLFRSIKVIGVASAIVAIGVVWTMGLIGLCGYEITAIMGLLPPLIIVIGIPNCVYLINKYQQVYNQTKDKEGALKTIIVKIGHITLLTNATTAFGLGTFAFTNTKLLVEFGIVASLGIVLLFFITILMVPILFSFLPAPKEKQTKHLQNGWLAKFLEILEHLALHKRKVVFVVTTIVVVASVVGAFLLRSTGRLIDDLPKGDKAKTDLAFYEDNLAGVMPFEIVLDFKKKGKYQSPTVLKNIDSAQRYLESLPEVSKTLSIVNALKFVNQAFYSGDPEKYKIPSGRDRGFIKKYIQNNNDNKSLSVNQFMDSAGTQTRVSAHVHDLGIDDLEELITTIKPKVDEIFNPEKSGILKYVDSISFNENYKEKDLLFIDSLLMEYPQIEFSYISSLKDSNPDMATRWYDEGVNKEELLANGKNMLNKVVDDTFVGVTITGFTVPFTRGTKYLIYNLFLSLLIAIIGIAILMSFLFKSLWMVVITIITNLIPLIFTAGVMGYFGVPLKPSTILVFSISLGIAVDDAIHFLAKYKQELKANNGDIRKSVFNALNETGISMLYTSIILFFGFSIFMASNYGGTQALGLLISVTLLVAMLSNLVLLPALLLSFEKKIEK